VELIQVLDHFIDQHNENPKPFVWTARAKDILAKLLRAQETLHNGFSV